MCTYVSGQYGATTSAAQRCFVGVQSGVGANAEQCRWSERDYKREDEGLKMEDGG